MKKFLILIISVFVLTGCSSLSSDYKDVLLNYINTELHEYTFSQYDDYNSGETIITDDINNDVATAILMLSSKIEIDFNSLVTKNGKNIEEVTSYYEEKQIYSIYDAFNMILVYKILDLDLTSLEDYCETLTIEELYNPWGVYDYLTAINCLSMLEVNSELKNDLIKEVNDFDSYDYIDADLASLVVIALQGNASNDFTNYLIKQVTTEGVYDLDYETGEKNKPNCPTTSLTAIALMSNGIVYNNNSLSSTILEFKAETGFKVYKDDEESDLSYASPQAFLAISTTYLFEITGNKVIFY